jgi:hypothetical protein
VKTCDQVDYLRLKELLEVEYGRTVTVDEATRTGEHLIRIYEILLSDDIDGGGIVDAGHN